MSLLAAAAIVGGMNLLNGYLSAKQAKKSAGIQAASLERQSALLGQQAGMYMQSARISAETAAAMIAVGKANARDYQLEAARVDRDEQRQLSEAIRERQQVVGRGLVGFAANGVLLSDSVDSAAARWEQDEAADLAYQQLLVMQEAQDRIYALGIEAKNALAQGYGAAASAYGQAMGAAASAYGTYLEGKYALSDAADARKSGKRAYRDGLLSSLVGAVGGGMQIYAAHYDGGGSDGRAGTPSGASMPA